MTCQGTTLTASSNVDRLADPDKDEEDSEEESDDEEEPVDLQEIVASFRRLEVALLRCDTDAVRELAGLIQSAISRGLDDSDDFAETLERLLHRAGLHRDKVAELQKQTTACLAAAAARRPYLPTDEELAQLPRLRRVPAVVPFSPAARAPQGGQRSMSSTAPATGEHYGLPFPRGATELADLGHAWLAKALRAARTLTEKSELVSMQVGPVVAGTAPGQSAGSRASPYSVLVSTELRHAADVDSGEALTERLELEVKFFQGTASCDRGFAEVMFYRVFVPGVPNIAVLPPLKFYFGDVDQMSNYAVLITSRVWPRAELRLGELPRVRRFCDEPTLGVDHYAAVVCALARLAAAYHRGDFGDAKVLALLPTTKTPPQTDAEDKQLIERATRDIAAGLDFATKTCPAVFPAVLRAPKFLQTLEEEYAKVVRNLLHVQDYLWAKAEYLCLAPRDLSLGAACFRELPASSGNTTLECTIVDWAGVAHVPVAMVLASLLQTGDPAHEEHLLRRFVESVAAEDGGPELELEELRLQVKAAQFLLLRQACADLSALYSLVPKADLRRVKGPRDPLVQGTDAIRYHAFNVVQCFRAWQGRGVYQALREWQRTAGLSGTKRIAPGIDLFGETAAAPVERLAPFRIGR